MDRIEKTREKFRELFRAEPTQNEGTDPEFMRILQRFIFGEVSYAGSLDNRMRELITITVLTVNQTLPQLKAHVGACLNVGLTPEEIREAVYQCAPFVGFPKTLNAIAAMNETFAERGISLPLADAQAAAEQTRYEQGLAAQAPIYGSEIAERYAWLPAEFSQCVPKWLTELCFSDFSLRKGLDQKCGSFSPWSCSPRWAARKRRYVPTFSVQCVRVTLRKRWSAHSATQCRTWTFPGC